MGWAKNLGEKFWQKIRTQQLKAKYWQKVQNKVGLKILIKMLGEKVALKFSSKIQTNCLGTEAT